MKVIPLPISLFDRVHERTVSLSTACRVLDTAAAAHTAAFRGYQARPCEQNAHAIVTTEYALDEAQALVISAAQVCASSMRMLLETQGGSHDALHERIAAVQGALKAETLAFEAYNVARPEDMGPTLAAWKASRVTVVSVARQLMNIGTNTDETDLDETSADHGA